MGVREHYSSLTTFSSSVLINVVIMLLIIIGGIGFCTWDDIKKSTNFILEDTECKVKLFLSNININNCTSATFLFLNLENQLEFRFRKTGFGIFISGCVT